VIPIYGANGGYEKKWKRLLSADWWFGKGGSALRPRAFYHDSYEYYGAEPKNGQDMDYKPLDASKWRPLKSGLIGPVCVRSQTRGRVLGGFESAR